MPAKILSCTCDHDYQDKKYGKGRRVHNQVQSQPGNEKYRCTVCLKEK